MRKGVTIGASALCLGILAAVFVFHPFAPTLPRAGIAPSWGAAMGEAADRPTPCS